VFGALAPRLLRARRRERSGAALLARAQAAIPEIDERRVARLQRMETEAIAGVLDIGAIVLLDERRHAGPRLPWRLGQSPGEVHVVFGLELFQLALETRELLRQIALRHDAYRGIRNHTSRSHSPPAYGPGRSSVRTS